MNPLLSHNGSCQRSLAAVAALRNGFTIANFYCFVAAAPGFTVVDELGFIFPENDCITSSRT